MTLNDAFKEAIVNRDTEKCSVIVDLLRFKYSYNYEAIYKLASKLTNISRTDWDSFMEEMDESDSED